MTPVAADLIATTATPGDIAVASPSNVIVADMTDGFVRTTTGNVPLRDVRSVVVHSGHNWVAAGAFSRMIYDSTTSTMTEVIDRLPVWTDSLEGGAWFADAARADIVGVHSSTVIHTPATHLTTFAFGEDRIWVADRPQPIVWELSLDGAVVDRHRLPSANAELTGICVDHTGKVLVLDRSSRALYRLQRNGFTPVARLPGIYARMRGLRRHTAGPHPYHVVDPQAQAVIWLSESLDSARIQLGRSSGLVLRAGLPQRGTEVQLSVAARWTLGYRGSTLHLTAPLALGARDVRLGPDGFVYVVLRDAHRVVVLDATTGKRRRVLGDRSILLYPCSVDIEQLSGNPHVIDPIRRRIVEFNQRGAARIACALRSSYVRWLRFAGDGTSWLLDLATQRLLRYEPGWHFTAAVALPDCVDAADVTSMEALGPNRLVLGVGTSRQIYFDDGRWWIESDVCL